MACRLKEDAYTRVVVFVTTGTFDLCSFFRSKANGCCVGCRTRGVSWCQRCCQHGANAARERTLDLDSSIGGAPVLEVRAVGLRVFAVLGRRPLPEAG